MKKCELCSKAARMYCESDDASLCWDCDSTVHAANFLVAKHTRTLLCHACQSPTPWSGSGPKLGPTVSACQACDTNGAEEEDEDDDDNDDDDDDDDDDEENGDLANEDEDDDENQVVPLSLASTSTSTSNSTSTTSGSEGSSVTRDGLSNSSFGLSTNASFFNEVSGREEEEDGGKKMRSWMWR